MTYIFGHRFGDKARKLTNDGLGVVGHMVGMIWNIYKIIKALNQKQIVKATTFVKSTAK